MVQELDINSVVQELDINNVIQELDCRTGTGH